MYLHTLNETIYNFIFSIRQKYHWTCTSGSKMTSVKMYFWQMKWFKHPENKQKVIHQFLNLHNHIPEIVLVLRGLYYCILFMNLSILVCPQWRLPRRTKTSMLNTRVARWFVFKPKIQILGKFWRVLQWKMSVYFMDTWSILRSFVIFYWHLV
jgi:hypothetical protein